MNQSLKLARIECVEETRRRRTNGNSSEGLVDGDSELFNKFLWNQTERWKSFVMCSLDCIAQKVGMVMNTVINSTNEHHLNQINFCFSIQFQSIYS